MTVYQAYFDTSGHQEDAEGPLVVAGLLAPFPAWQEFDRAWLDVLGGFEVPYLHMSEFSHGRGAFRAWRKDKSKRARFLGQLTELVTSTVEHALISVAMPRDFRSVNEEYALEESTTGLFPIVAGTALGVMDDWVRANRLGHSKHFVFEKGDRGQGAFMALLPLDDCPVSIVPKKNPDGDYITPLQAADLVAYEWRLEMLRADNPENVRPPRRSYLSLRRLHTAIHSQNAASMKRICEAHPQLYPRRSD